VEDKEFNRRRKEALIALACREPSEPGPCPSEAELAAFIEGEMEGERREEMLAHLDACPECYDTWLTAGSFVQAEDERQRPERISSITEAVRGRSRRAYWISGASLALAAGLAFLLLWTPPSDSRLSRLIGQSYDQWSTLKGSGPIAPEVHFLWKSTSQPYGFGGPRPPSELQTAFGAGLSSRAENLLGEKGPVVNLDEMKGRYAQEGKQWPEAWEKTEWSPFYLLGQWSALLWTVCRSGAVMPAELWTSQKEICELLRKEIAASKGDPEAVGIIGEALGRVAAIMDTAAGGGTGGSMACQSIQAAIESMVNRLVPQGLLP